MKNFAVFSIICLSQVLAFGKSTHLDQIYTDEIRVSKIAENIINRGSQNGASEITPELAQGQLYQLGNTQYTEGVAKLEHLEYLECKVQELIALEKIRSSIKESGKIECYQNFVDNYKEECVKNWTLEHIYPVINAGASSFAQKYRCNGIHESSAFKGKSDIVRVKALYHTLYSKALNFFYKKIKNDPKAQASEYEVATHKQCSEGLDKQPIVNLKASNSCKMPKNECRSHSDCCSEVCVKSNFSDKGKCSTAFSCYAYLDEGEQCGRLDSGELNFNCDKRTKNLSCLAVNYDSSSIGECTADGEKPSADRPCCSDKVEENGLCTKNLRCSTCLGLGEKPTDQQQCCEGFYKSLNGTCIQDFPPFGPVSSIKNNFKSISQKIISSILRLFISSAHAQSNCVEGVTCSNDNLESVHLEAGKNCFELNDDGSTPSDEEIQSCLKGNRNIKFEKVNTNLKEDENQINAHEFIKGKNINQLQKTLGNSSYKECRFNLFEDRFFRESPNNIKNAELMLRGFEYIYSGQGTIDYWIDDSKLSIFEKAQKLAMQYRKFRSKTIETYNKANIELRCMCLAHQGKKSFPDQRDFVSSNCTATELADYDSDSKSISGALGISQEKIMMTYIDKKMSINFNSFKEYEKLAERFDKLFAYINEMKWEKAWDKQEFIYDFTAKKFSDEVKTFLEITAPIIGPMIVSAVEDDTERPLEEALRDRKVVNIFPDKTGGRLIHMMTKDWYGPEDIDNYHKDFKRYYVGPYYKTSESSHLKKAKDIPAEKECDVYASSRSCIKNIHQVTFEGESRYLLDAKFPEFVGNNAYEKDSQLIQKINKAYDHGIGFLRHHNPTNVIWWDPYGRIESAGDFGSLTPDSEIIVNKFTPGQGGWSPTVFNGSAAFKNAMKKYVSCKSLKECGAKNIKNNPEVEEFGFGYLFKKQEDINSYVDYVYHSHFLWPSLSAANNLSYPTQATLAYFQTLKNMIDQLKNASANKALDLGDVYEGYKADYERRLYDYQGGAAHKEGKKSQNTKYSKDFRALFRQLNFAQNTTAAQLLNKKSEIAKNESNFNKSELDALNAAASNSALNHKKQKRLEHYNNTVGSTARGIVKQNAKQKMLAKHASPLSKVSLTNNGRQYGKQVNLNLAKGLYKSAPSKQIALFSASKSKFKPYKKKKNTIKSTKSSQVYNSNGQSAPTFDSTQFIIPESNDEVFRPKATDSLFKLVSKAYGRSLSRIFVKKSAKVDDNEVVPNKINFKIDDSQKEQLKKLLEK